MSPLAGRSTERQWHPLHTNHLATKAVRSAALVDGKGAYKMEMELIKRRQDRRSFEEPKDKKLFE